MDASYFYVLAKKYKQHHDNDNDNNDNNNNANTGLITPPQKVRVDLARIFLVPP